MESKAPRYTNPQGIHFRHCADPQALPDEEALRHEEKRCREAIGELAPRIEATHEERRAVVRRSETERLTAISAVFKAVSNKAAINKVVINRVVIHRAVINVV